MLVAVLEGFDLIILESLDKSLEYVCDGIPIQQKKVHVWYPLQKGTYPRNWHFFFTIAMNLKLSFYLSTE